LAWLSGNSIGLAGVARGNTGDSRGGGVDWTKSIGADDAGGACDKVIGVGSEGGSVDRTKRLDSFGAGAYGTLFEVGYR
jgi:hypothetical protein